MDEREQSRRNFLTRKIPGMSAFVLSAAAGGASEQQEATGSEMPVLDFAETQRILFEGAPFPDEFSGRTARMRSLYAIAQETATELFVEKDFTFEPQALTFLNDRYMTAVTTEHQFRSLFLQAPWTVHEAVAPSSAGPVVYANAENGNPWLSTSDPRADMEFTLMSIAAQFQGASAYTMSPGITFPDKNAYASWGGYMYANSEDGPELFQRFADGLNIYAARVLLLKKHLNYLSDHHGIEIPGLFYPISQFHAFAEYPVIEILNRLHMSAEELARVTNQEGASSMLSLIASTYIEHQYEEITGIEPQTAAREIVQLPELISGDNLEQRIISYDTVLLSAMDRLLPPTTTPEEHPEQKEGPLPDPRTITHQGNFVLTVA
ncbi:hypothetical protein HY469_01895 [Candidatus Roizmanbacteria bacterium]|nr:hypothetical protein [Candidatus Roizmanbacteria bacterium]